MHDYAELYGLDSMKDMKELLAADPTISRDFEEDTNMIRAIHPTWSPLNVALQESIDHARRLSLERANERNQRGGLSGIQTRLPTSQGFANLMGMQPESKPQEFRQQLEDATEQHLGLREQQQIAAQQPGQTAFRQQPLPMPPSYGSPPTTDEEGQPTGFVRVSRPEDYVQPVQQQQQNQ